MQKIKVGVIFGGQSTEHNVSIVSGSSVIKNMNKEKYDIFPIYINENGEWYHYIKPVNEIEIFNIDQKPKELKKIYNEFETLKKQDIIFPVLHGLYGEDGTIQGLLELLKIPYVGCKVLASSICMNKIYTKIILEKANIKQTKSIILNAKKDSSYIYIDNELNHIEKQISEICKILEDQLKYPVFVKPANSGSSIGVTKALNCEELMKSIKIASNYDKEIIVEQGIDGREVECAVLGVNDVNASCIGEVLSADQFYDYNSKYKNADSKTNILADISDEISEKIKVLAVKAFKAVNGTGLARVDFFIDKQTNEIYLNEINTIPGFTNISMYPQLWENCGIPYSKLLDKLIEISL